MTPHRMLHTALTEDQYKLAIRSFDRHFAKSQGFFFADTAEQALTSAFVWAHHGRQEYWFDIHQSLFNAK